MSKARRPRWKRWTIDILIVVAVLGAVTLWQQRGMLATDGAPAPDFTLPLIDGGSVSLQELEGKPVLVHFWATWCGVCRREFGMLNRLHDRLEGRAHLVTIAVNSGSIEDVRAFARERDLRFPIAVADEEVARRYQVPAYPTNYFLDAELRLQGRSVGMSTGAGIRARLWWYGR